MKKRPLKCYAPGVYSISAQKFKEQSPYLLDHIDEDGIVITRRGRPIAKLVRVESNSAQLIGALKGKLKIKGDIFSTGERWT